jgi:DNA-binding transcriptional LysR family regulator
LFIRRPGGFELSKAGAQVLEFAERMELDALGVERGVSGRDEGLTGTVRITASEWLVTNVLAHLMGPLLSRHPGLAIELVADQRHVNLVRREADLALRPRPFEHDAILQRATAKVSFSLYAARAYLAKRTVPAVSLGRGHVLIAMTDDVGDIARNWLKSVLPEATPSVRTNGRDAMVSLASAGVGIACLARIVGDEIRTLERVPVSLAAPTVKLWLGMHRDLQGTPRVREVASYLTKQLRALQPRLCPGDPG